MFQILFEHHGISPVLIKSVDCFFAVGIGGGFIIGVVWELLRRSRGFVRGLEFSVMRAEIPDRVLAVRLRLRNSGAADPLHLVRYLGAVEALLVAACIMHVYQWIPRRNRGGLERNMARSPCVTSLSPLI